MSSNVLDEYTINRESPANYVEGELDFCKNEFSYNTFDVRIINLKNSIVNYRGFAYESHKLALNKYSLLEPDHYKEQLLKRHYLKNVLFKRKRNLGNDKFLLAFDDWSNWHYHWFCDVLPRLYSIKDLLKDYILLLPNSEYVKSVGLESLTFFGLNPAGIEFINELELVRARNLSIITHTCLTGYTNDKILLQMQAFIETKINYRSVTKKLYVTRENAKYRKVLNESAVLEIVKENGYEVVKFEEMNWREQVLNASSAQSIVSLHGAGLTNMIFMSKGSSVLEFRRDKIFHNQCFWHLASALKLNYYYLFGTPDNDELVIEGGDCCNLTINTEKLHETLIKMSNDQNKRKISTS
jgi:hypothetical protein